MKDWVGDKNSIYKTLGASNHTDKDREENDFYATEPKSIDVLVENFPLTKLPIWEPACGQGHMSERLNELGFSVWSTDLIDRGYTKLGAIQDFLAHENGWGGHIVTNPPYKYAKEFVYKSLDLVEDDNYVCMFLKLQFMEGKERKKLFLQHPPYKILVSSSRLLCAKNGDFDGMKAVGGSAVAYAWYIWKKGFKGETTIKWVN